MVDQRTLPDLSVSEENYIKGIFKLSQRIKGNISTNAIAEEFGISAASVTDMLQKLGDKNLLNYEKYKGATLTTNGEEVARKLLRKHRLWEVFLVDKLNFSWDEVHDVAEQMEHIRSDKLVDELDKFLGRPKYDPHGDPIPDEEGKIQPRQKLSLAEMRIGQKGEVVGVEESDDDFLRYLDKIGIRLGSLVEILDTFDYDNSMAILVAGVNEVTVSAKVAENLWLRM